MFVRQSEAAPADSAELLRVAYRGKYVVKDFADPATGASRAFFVLRGLKSAQPNLYKLGYKLEKGMVIKIGKVKLAIKELCYPKCDLLLNKINEEVPVWSCKELTEAETECRICRGIESTRENPLVSPCKCSGSIKYAHVNCVKAWYATKTTRHQSPRTTSYSIRGLRCEICKKDLHVSFSYSGVCDDLVRIPRPEEGYLVLESLGYDNQKLIYVCTLAPDLVFTIVLLSLNTKGRTHASDIKITDISVSRHHAVLKVIGNAVFLDDNDSKFGTLVEIREELELVADRPYYIQIGETVMALLVKGPRAERRLTSSQVHCRNVQKEPTKDSFP